MVVTIDGPAGVGKSTIARRVAGALEIAYLDTGAMFRLLGLELGKVFKRDKNFDEVPKNELLSVLEAFVFTLQGSGEQTSLLCNGEAVSSVIRTEKAGMLAANIGIVPEVRTFLKASQRKLGENFSLLAEGRDMGTVVFPDAFRKFFLDATAEVRAQRRCKQLLEMGMSANLEELLLQIKERDYQDRNRSLAPLTPAHDAIIIDTSDLNLNDVFEIIIGKVEK